MPRDAITLGRGDELRRGIPKSAQIRFNADFWRSAVDCDALRDDQWERLKEFCAGRAEGQARASHGQSSVFERAVVDGALGRALARFAEAAWQA